MTIEAGEVSVKINADASGLTRGVSTAQQKLKSFESSGSSSFNNLSIAAVAAGNMIATVFAAAFSAVGKQLSAAISRFDTVNNYANVMQNLGIASSVSESSVNKLQESIMGLPTTLDSAVAATQRLVASNGNLAASTDMFIALNNAILAGTNDTNMQASALEQLLQAYSKGKPEMQDWKTLLQAMPAQLKQVATAMGYASTNELYDALQNGKITMNDFMATVMKLNNEGVAGFASFSEQARANCAGVSTAITNMKTAISRGLANIMDAIGQSNIAAFFGNITSAINTAMNYIAAFVKVVKQAVAWVSALFGGSGSTSGIVEAADSASDSISSMASGASGVTDNLDDATSSAKKLSKQLAGFDEMNVLKEQTSSSGNSSSGSTGANMAITDYSWANDYASGASDKIESIFKSMMNSLKKIFNFDKIKKAFTRFVDDVKKALDPIGKILSQIWNDYLLPFVSWAGNDLLPAFFNALGGAINLVGQIIGGVWDSFLKPFIDNFLVPIAQWTGGIIVNVLNGIGDALRAISENQPLVDFITDLIGVFGTLAVAIGAAITAGYAYNVMAGILNGTLGTLGLVNEGLPLLFEGTAIAESAAATATGIFTGAVNALNATIEFLTGTVGGVLVAVTAFVAVFETVKLVFNTGNECAEAYRRTQENLRNTTARAAQAAEDQKTAIESVNNAQLAASDAELQLLELTKSAREAREKYNNMLNSGRYSQEDLTKAQLEAEIAEGRLEAGMKNLEEKTQDVIDGQNDYHDAVMREIVANKEAELRTIAKTGDYEKLYEALLALTQGEADYALKSGETYHMTREEAQIMANGLLQTFDQAGMGMKTWLDDTEKQGAKIRQVFSDMADSAAETLGNMEPSGNAFDQGVAKGIIKNKWVVEAAARELATSGKVAYNKIMGINSPSKVMKKSGGWFAEGIAVGISDKTKDVVKSVSSLSDMVTSAFDGAEVSIPVDLTSSINDFDIPKTAAEELASSIDLEPTMTHVVVNLGDEKLIDKVVQGINDLSTMKNRSVINI